VLLTVTYYFDCTPASVDIDNIIKPIADALVGLAYVDDSQMRRVCSSRVDAAGLAVLPNSTPLLVSALGSPWDFVHLIVTLA
jgi:crossover junction endodeoxyribonuclease RusA